MQKRTPKMSKKTVKIGRTIVYNHRQRKVDAAQEKLHQAELDVEAAEQKSDRLHRESIDHLTNESQAAYTKSRLRLQERTEIRLSREEELANAQVKLGRAKQFGAIKS